MSKKMEQLKQVYKETKKSSIVVYILLRILVIICMVLQILRGDLNNALLCGLSLVLFTAPMLIRDKLKIELPNLLEIIIYLFIFSAEVLGEIYNFYGNIPNWDMMLHTLNGFLCAGIGFSLIDLLNENSEKLNLSPLYVAIVAFCFSMTVGVCWEFFEFASDNILKVDMQKDEIITTISSTYLDENNSNNSVVVKNIGKTVVYDNNGNVIKEIDGGYLDIGLRDTMNDLEVNFIGAITFSVLGYAYIHNREKYKFASNFIPKKVKK